MKKIPVIILSGFLGSGKTTLFRNLLAQSKKIHIPISGVVNDMSELDIDGEILGNTTAVEENDKILISIHACLLSSDKGIKKLDQAMTHLCARKETKMIIIETSGSCHPLPLVEYFQKQNQAKLTGMFNLVDSLMLAQDFDNATTLIPTMQSNLASGKRDTVNLLVEQIMFSSHIFLTKCDRIEKERLSLVGSAISSINPFAAVHDIQFGRVDLKSLFELQEYDYFKVAKLIEELKPILASETKNERPYDLATCIIKDERPFHPRRLWDVCHKFLDKKIYRSKGFFWLASRDKYSILWNQAAGGINLEIIGLWRSTIIAAKNHGISETEIDVLKEMISKENSQFGDRRCDLTVIGDKSHVNLFTDALKSCFLSNEEIELWHSGHTFEDPWPKKMVRFTN